MIDGAMRDAWRDLENKLRPFIARRVSPADVDDVMQDVFLRMQRGLQGLRDDERFGPWVYQVARNAIVDHHRASARLPVLDNDAMAAFPEASSADDATDDDDAAQAFAMFVAPFVAAMPSPYREALTLTDLEGLTQKDAADMLGISLSGMKSRVQRGRRQLRAALEACCAVELDARGHVLSFAPRDNGAKPDGCCAKANGDNDAGELNDGSQNVATGGAAKTSSERD